MKRVAAVFLLCSLVAVWYVVYTALLIVSATVTAVAAWGLNHQMEEADKKDKGKRMGFNRGV